MLFGKAVLGYCGSDWFENLKLIEGLKDFSLNSHKNHQLGLYFVIVLTQNYSKISTFAH
ncbi:hypothetical protein FLJC2902T_11700 [Flavobacterium limnosediminis JC2902]|uniref:Uncharacterized protein n=1 Tax=Flavobacterium limnosediminis JC2902 TaxID=1341181 RepID=V6SRP8_9FLAO|nr:hypothetical protein FLJC2902T_11700 [Flavobacterium limnosediminis JC2902]